MDQTPEQLACRVDTMTHIDEVRRQLRAVIVQLLLRAEQHDQSKLSPEELDTFAEYGPKLKSVTYGSPEYQQNLAEMDVALKHHYRNNRHHPEHWENGVEDMTLVDLVEMFCDWVAATKRHADGDILKSIKLNTDRFGLSPQLAAILVNTARFGEGVATSTKHADLPQFEPAGPPCEDPHCTGVLVDSVDLRTQGWFQRCSKCGKDFNRVSGITKLGQAKQVIERAFKER